MVYIQSPQYMLSLKLKHYYTSTIIGMNKLQNIIFTNYAYGKHAAAKLID